MRSKIIIILLMFATMVQASDGTQGDTTIYLSIDSCVAKSMRNSLEIQIAELKIEKIENEKGALLSMYFPKVAANGGLAYVFNDMQLVQSIEGFVPPFVIDNANISNVLLDLINDQLAALRTDLINAWNPINVSLKGAYMAGLTLTQPIFAGGRIMTGNAMAKLGIDMANDNLLLKREETYYNAVQSYWLYVSVMEKVKIARNYVEMLEEVVDMLEDVESVDMMNKNDVLKAQVELNSVRLMLTQAENGLVLSKMSLCHIMGMDYDTEIIPTDTIKYDGNSLVLDDIYHIPDSAIEKRAEYRLLNNMVEMKDKESRLLLGDYLPTVGLAASYGIIGGVELMGHKEKPYNITNVMATVNIPLTHWWEGAMKLKAAKVDKTIAELEFKDKTRLMELQIKQAMFGLEEAYKLRSNTLFSLKQAEENLRLTNDRYKVELETIVNVLKAQAEWQNTYSNMVDAHINFHLKELEFYRVTSQLRIPY